MRKTFTMVMVILSFVSAITTWQGLVYENRLADNFLQRDIIPVFAAIATFGIACVFWIMLFKRYPQMDETRKKKFHRIYIPVVCVFIFSSSTIYSVIGIGGYPALTNHMNSSVSKAEEYINGLGVRVERENNLITPLDLYSVQFNSLSELEEKSGVTTGYSGKGNVTILLRSLSKTFSNLSEMIRKSTGSRREALMDATEEIVSLKQLINDPMTSMDKKLASFAQKLGNVNQKLNEVASVEIVMVTKEVIKQLNELSAVSLPEGNSEIEKAQKNARFQLSEAVAGAKKTLEKFTGELSNQENNKFENLENISMSVAILKYWFLIWPQICLSLALDFVPLVFLFVLDTTKKEEEEDEREKQLIEVERD